MNEPGFTKGPWEFQEPDGCVRKAGDQNRHNYVRISSPWRESAHSAEDDPEVAANMFLIAAAPELYEAVERALRYAQNIGVDDESSSYTNQLRAALAKARGHHD